MSLGGENGETGASQKNGKETGWNEKRRSEADSESLFWLKHGLCSSEVYCGKLRRYVDDVMYCPHFESEPLEYKLYRRSWKDT